MKTYLTIAFTSIFVGLTYYGFTNKMTDLHFFLVGIPFYLWVLSFGWVFHITMDYISNFIFRNDYDSIMMEGG